MAEQPGIDERLKALAEHGTLLSEIQEKAEQRMDRLEKMQEKTDRRINRLFEITLRIGADFAERLRKLEQGENGDSRTGSPAGD